MERDFPRFSAERLEIAKKIYVIANNSWLSRIDHAFVNPNKCDIIVQFNDCIHFDRFKRIKCRKIYVFREKESTGDFWGIKNVYNKINNEDNDKEFVFIFNYCGKMEIAENNLLVRTARSGGYSFFENGAAPPSFEPVYDVRDGRRVQPTTGYITLRLLYEYVRANCQNTRIIAVGFSGVPVGLWCGHQIDHERAWLMKSGIKRIRHSKILELCDWSHGIMRLLWGKLKGRAIGS